MSRIGPREPAPAQLATRRSLSDLLWIANTRHGPGGHWFARVSEGEGDHDHLVGRSHALKYLDAHQVSFPSEELSTRHLEALAAIRDMVRGLVEPSASWTPAVTAILANARFKIEQSGQLIAARAGWVAYIDDLMLPLLQLVEMRERVRVCANPSCRLMFLDLSRNRARIWCDNAGCGNRARVRRYRTQGAQQAPEAMARARRHGATAP